MKITLVCGHYVPSLGYLEVHLAKALAQLNHETSVITTTAIPAYIKHLAQGFGENPEGVEVIRLKPIFTLGQIVASREVNKTLRGLNPDLVIVIGLGKYFPKPVFKTRYPIVTLLGDNAHSYASTSLKSKILMQLFKKPTYRVAVRRSKKLVAYTPESFEAAAKILPRREAEILRKQNHFVSLGFWSDTFFYSPLLRVAKRAELGYSENDKVIITATRVVANKNLEGFIPSLATTPNHVKWLIIGSAQDEYAEELKDIFENFLGKDKVRLLPYMEKNELNALYNAADLALYTVPAISIFEAIGTGLQTIVGEDKSLQKIWKSKYFFTAYRGGNTELDQWMYNDNETDEVREARSLTAKEDFGWLRIAKEIISEE